MRRFLHAHTVRPVILSLTLGLLFAAAPLGTAAAQDAKVRIAVLNLENNSTWHWWGDNLGAAAADEIVTQLVQSGSFTVIERAQLDAILAEQNLGASGRVTASTAAQIGKLLGVQLMLTGSITQFSVERTSIGFRGIGGSYSNAESKLDIRLINTETGEILMAAEGQGNKRMGGGYFKGASAERTFDQGAAQEALRPAVEHVVTQVTGQAGQFATLQPVAPESQIVGSRDGLYYLNRGENASIQVGQRFEVRRVVDEIKDANGAVLDRVVSTVGTIEVTQVLSQSAVAKVVDGEAREGDTLR